MRENRIEDRGILAGLPVDLKDGLFNAGKIIEIKKGHILFSEREEIESLFIVVDGFMALYRNSRYGEIKVIFICTNGELLNEVVLQNEKTSICSKALTDTKLLAIHKSEIYKLLKENPDLQMLLFNSLAKKTRRLYHQVGNANGTYPLEKRLAAKIWKLARDYGYETDEGKRISFETTVTFLANMLGSKRESVSRQISQMKANNILIHENGYLIIKNMDKLKEIAL